MVHIFVGAGMGNIRLVVSDSPLRLGCYHNALSLSGLDHCLSSMLLSSQSAHTALYTIIEQSHLTLQSHSLVSITPCKG